MLPVALHASTQARKPAQCREQIQSRQGERARVRAKQDRKQAYNVVEDFDCVVDIAAVFGPADREQNVDVSVAVKIHERHLTNAATHRRNPLEHQAAVKAISKKPISIESLQNGCSKLVPQFRKIDKQERIQLTLRVDWSRLRTVSAASCGRRSPRTGPPAHNVASSAAKMAMPVLSHRAVSIEVDKRVAVRNRERRTVGHALLLHSAREWSDFSMWRKQGALKHNPIAHSAKLMVSGKPGLTWFIQ